jgi:hypothetical protein
MTDYRDVLGASLERLEHLERDLVAARRGDATSDALALRLENELLQLDREWRSKAEHLGALEERRRRRLKLASSLLFLLLALAGIAMLFLGTTVPGFVCFAASIAGWILAGLQESRHARLMRLYEEDRRRVDRTLQVVRATMRGVATRTRIATENRDEDADAAVASVAEESDAEGERRERSAR